MRPSATTIERIQLSQVGAAGISEEASRSNPRPSRNRTIAVKQTDFHMTVRTGGENIWIKDPSASESIREGSECSDIPALHYRATVTFRVAPAKSELAWMRSVIRSRAEQGPSGT
jgi:hypothetical protein